MNYRFLKFLLFLGIATSALAATPTISKTYWEPVLRDGKAPTSTQQASARTDLNADIRYSRIRQWARDYRGLRAEMPIMSSPPTVTTSTATSFATGVTYAYTDSRLTVLSNKLIDNGSGRGVPSAGTLTGGGKTSAGPTRVQFMTDAPEIEFIAEGTQLASINIMVDGQLAFTRNPVQIRTSSIPQYVKFSFGANAVNYECVQTQAVPAGGTGYVVGDTVTWQIAGTGTQSIVSTVIAATSITSAGPPIVGGVVTGFQLKTGGLFTAYNTSNLVQLSTSGTGSGASTTPVFAPVMSTRKMRKIEFIFSGVSNMSFRGVRVDNLSTVQPCPAPANMPKWCFVGDSQLYGTYLTADGMRMAERIAWRLGVWERHSINSMGGTGYAQASGSAPSWVDPLRVQDFIDENADVYCLMGSQNGDDTIASNGTYNAVISLVNQILAAKPNAIIVGVGNLLCVGSTQTKAAYQALIASHPGQVVYVDPVDLAPVFDKGGGVTNKPYALTSDGAHLAQGYLFTEADTFAPPIGAGVVNVVTSP